MVHPKQAEIGPYWHAGAQRVRAKLEEGYMDEDWYQEYKSEKFFDAVNMRPQVDWRVDLKE